jgi:hypothetical protein
MNLTDVMFPLVSLAVSAAAGFGAAYWYARTKIKALETQMTLVVSRLSAVERAAASSIK